MPPPPDDIEQQMAELKRGYASQLPEKAKRVESICEAFFMQPWDEERCSTACRSAHSLAGSSGTYGFGELGKVAKLLENLIKGSLDRKTPLGDGELADARKHLGTLKELAAAAGA